VFLKAVNLKRRQDEKYSIQPNICRPASLPPPLLVAQGTSTTHYYLYEYTDEDGNPEACVIEIHSETVEDPPGSEFTEVSLEQLHQKGYLTTAEQLAQTPPEYIDTKDLQGRIGRSWIKLWWNGSHIESYCGSQTITPFTEYIKVTGLWERYIGDQLYSKRGPHDRVDINGTEVDIWWRGTHNPFVFNPPRYFKHHQHGWHQWGRDNENPIRTETDRWRDEPPPQE